MAENAAGTTGAADGRRFAASAKAFDYDRYVAALLAAPSDQEDLFVLLACAGEISAIPDKVSEPRLGQIRLQWWRDAMELPRGQRTGNPLADAMREMMTRRGIAAPLLLGYIDACEFDLDGRPMPDEQHLKAYLVKTEATLFQASARVLGGDGGAIDAACEWAGLALGRARLVLGFARRHASGRPTFPAPVASNVRHEDADLPNENVRDEFDRILHAAAGEALAEAREAIERVGRLPRRVRTAFLPVATVEGDIDRWLRIKPDPLREAVRPGSLSRLWRIWRMHRRWGRAP